MLILSTFHWTGQPGRLPLLNVSKAQTFLEAAHNMADAFPQSGRFELILDEENDTTYAVFLRESETRTPEERVAAYKAGDRSDQDLNEINHLVIDEPNSKGLLELNLKPFWFV